MRAARKTLRKTGGLFGLFKTYKPDPSLPVYKSKSGKQITQTLPDPKNYNSQKIIFSKDGKSWSSLNDSMEVREYWMWKDEMKYESMKRDWDSKTPEQKMADINAKLRDEIGLRAHRGKPKMTPGQVNATIKSWMESYNNFHQGYLVGEDGKAFYGGKKNKRKTRRRRA